MTNDGIRQRRASVWYLMCSMLNKGLPFLLTAVVVRMVSSEEYGYYTGFVTWFAVLQIVLTGSLHTSVNKARYEFGDEHDAYMSSVLVLGSLITLGFLAVFALFPAFFADMLDIRREHLFLMFGCLLAAPAFQILQQRERIAVRYRSYAAITVMMSAFTMIMTIICVASLKDKESGLVAGRLVPMALVSAAAWAALFIKGRRAFDKRYWRFALRLSIPLIPHELSMIILSTSDRIIIGKFCGKGDVALYAIAYTCATCLSLVTNSLNLAFSPWMYEQLSKNNFAAIRARFGRLMRIIMCLAVLLMLMGPELVMVFGGSGYAGAEDILPCVILGLLVQAGYIPLVIAELNEKRSLNISLATCAAAALNIVLNFITIPRFGYQAAAYTTLAGYMALYGMHYAFCKSAGCAQVTNAFAALGRFAAMAAFAALCMALYRLAPVIRYALAAVSALTAAGVYLRRRRKGDA